MAVPIPHQPWADRAACRHSDPDVFFPEKGGSTVEAKRICGGCPVRVECLEWSLDADERFGTWGGLSERERRRLKRQFKSGEVGRAAYFAALRAQEGLAAWAM